LECVSRNSGLRRSPRICNAGDGKSEFHIRVKVKICCRAGLVVIHKPPFLDRVQSGVFLVFQYLEGKSICLAPPFLRLNQNKEQLYTLSSIFVMIDGRSKESIDI
jgi:hypothetical protein